MTQMPDSVSPTPQKKGGVPIIVWLLGGCGCLGFGTVFLGIIAAIALPSFLNQVEKAGGSEAKSTIGMINRAQQAFQLKNETFATSINELDVSISGQLFEYQVIPQPDPSKSAIATAIPVEPNFKSYTGFGFLVDSAGYDFISGLCESDAPSRIPPAAPSRPSAETESVQCPPGSSLVE